MPSNALGIGELNLHAMKLIHPWVTAVKPKLYLVNLHMNWSIARRENLLINGINIPGFGHIIFAGSWQMKFHSDIENWEIGCISQKRPPYGLCYRNCLD